MGSAERDLEEQLITTLRDCYTFISNDGAPREASASNHTLVNIQDWSKNTFEVVGQLRINTDDSHHRYNVTRLVNDVPCVQIKFKTLSINSRPVQRHWGLQKS